MGRILKHSTVSLLTVYFFKNKYTEYKRVTWLKFTTSLSPR